MIIYLIRKIPNTTTAGSARINAEEREKKERQVRKAKENEIKGLPTTTPAIDELIWDEEQKGKQKKEETRSGTSTQLPSTICRLLRPAGIMQWAILKPPPRPQGDQ